LMKFSVLLPDVEFDYKNSARIPDGRTIET